MVLSSLIKYACFGDGDMCSIKDDNDNIQRYVKFEDIENFLKIYQNQLLSTSQINQALKNMESNDQRIDFLSDSFAGICRHCGSVTDVCYCMRDD